jgi:carboxyl-terminal processing protease
MPQAPAFAAGLRSGDLILQIDGEPTAGLDRISAIQRLRGPVGQELHLTIRRPPSLNEFEVKIRRGLIPAPSVVGDSLQPDGSWEYWLPEDPRIAYLQIIEFLDKTDVELADALAQVRPKAQALILDLRSNGGGLLTQAVRVADMFLPPGCLIVETRGRQRRMVQPSSITYSSDPWDDDRPLVVLVDQETASASEIVAACWQDHHRAIIVGEQTFGKGTIQDSIPLEPGRSSMRFTTATFWRPSGLNIDRGSANGSDDWGVRPDIGFEVKLSEDERRQVDGLRYRRQYKLFNIFESTAAPAPLPQDSATPPAPRLTEDPVLQRAIDHLRQTLDRTVST